MKQKVIDLLNKARSAELSAINQYMIHHYELKDKDFGKLASKIKEIAVVEMKHAEKLAERILFLKGTPTSEPDGMPKKGQEIHEILSTDMALETQAITMYNEAAVICSAEGDQKSKDLFEELLAEEEKHLHYFQKITSHLDRLGEMYLVTLTGK